MLGPNRTNDFSVHFDNFYNNIPPFPQNQSLTNPNLNLSNELIFPDLADGANFNLPQATHLDRYQILRMRDMPQATLIPVTAPADKAQHAGRGIGEAVMCPIAPAVLNALAMATGIRFRTTPVTPQRIREALR